MLSAKVGNTHAVPTAWNSARPLGVAFLLFLKFGRAYLPRFGKNLLGVDLHLGTLLLAGVFFFFFLVGKRQDDPRERGPKFFFFFFFWGGGGDMKR